MNDLIKREELLDYLRTIPIDLGYREMEDVVTFVEKMKSVDSVEVVEVVEVVRCKDCQCYDSKNYYCTYLDNSNGPDGFCNFGERETDG